MTFEDEIRSEATKLWEQFQKISAVPTDSREIIQSYFEKAILVGATMAITKTAKIEQFDGITSVKLT